MALERLTQITEVGIQSGITLRNVNVEGAYVSGVVTATSLNITGGGANFVGVVTATSFNGNVTGNITPTGLVVSGVSTFQSSSFWGDGDIAYFGDGQDLLIFHNSTDSIIRDNGTGDLNIEGGNRIKLMNPTGIETYAVFNQDGAVQLYYDNLVKFSTISTGAYIDGNLGIGTANPSAKLDVEDNNSSGYIAEFRQKNTSNSAQILIDSPTNNESRAVSMDMSRAGVLQWSIGQAYNDTNQSFHIATSALQSGNTGSKLCITSSGNIGIGTINPTSLLHLSSTTTPQLNVQAPTGESQIRISSSAGNYRRIIFYDNAPTPTKNNFEIAVQEVDNSLFFGPSTTVGGLTFSGSTGLRVDSSGRLTLPSQPAFFSRPTGNYDIVAGETTIGGTWNDVFDRGNNFSNGTFTAPVAGVYQFSWAPFLTLETTRQDAYINVNGSNVMREEITGYNSTSNRSGSVHGIYQLSANDAVTFGVYSTAGNTIYVAVNPWCYACGYLIG